MFSHPVSIEEAKLLAMQSKWQHGRHGSSSMVLFEEVTETEDLLTLPLQVRITIQRKKLLKLKFE